MATPHADRLHKMEAWRTSAMEDSHRHLTAVSQALVEIAAGNREVAADLGLEGATGQAARASFDRLARRMIKASDRLKQIVKASTEALTAGIDARNESIEIQTKLKDVNDGFQRAEKVRQASGGGSSVPGMGMTAAEIEAQREAAHAEIDALAKKSLSKLNGRILAAIDTLPPDGRTGQTTAHAGSRDTRPGNERVGDGPAAGQNTGPARSATAWAASVDTSLGTPGRHAPDGGHGPAAGDSGLAGGPIGGGVSLQGSHYAPPASGATAPSNLSVGAAGHSPAVFNPLASAAAVGGGAAVAGYRAYQAARPVQTPAYRPSAVRAAGAAPTPSARSAGIVRGATTAARAQTTTTGSTAAGRSSGSVRGGATGIARPAPAQASTRSSGILRGTTTAARTPTASSTLSGRSSGILRGTTTAVRKPTTAEASAGQPGGRTPARGTGSGSAARILTGGRTPTTSSSQSTGSSQKTGTSSRRAGSSRSASTGARPSQPGTGQAGVRGGSASRALHNLTGRPDKNKKARRHRNDEPTQSIAPYEDDKTVTFLPAGHIDNTNPQPR